MAEEYYRTVHYDSADIRYLNGDGEYSRSNSATVLVISGGYKFHRRTSNIKGSGVREGCVVRGGTGVRVHGKLSSN